MLSTSPAFSIVVPATLQVPVAGWPQKRELGPLSSGQGKLMQFVDPDRIEQSDRVQAASFAPVIYVFVVVCIYCHLHILSSVSLLLSVYVVVFLYCHLCLLSILFIVICICCHLCILFYLFVVICVYCCLCILLYLFVVICVFIVVGVCCHLCLLLSVFIVVCVCCCQCLLLSVFAVWVIHAFSMPGTPICLVKLSLFGMVTS